MHKFLCDIIFQFFGINIKVLAGSYGKSMFDFVRSCQTVFQSGHSILHSHQLCMRVSVVSHPGQNMVVSVLDFGHSHRCVVEESFI